MVTSLQPFTPYYFRVTAVNGSVEGGFSPDVLATTPADTAAPAWPDNSALTALPSGGEVVLSWPAASDNVSVTGYQVYLDTTQLTTVSGTTYTVTGLSTGSYNFSVIAVDAAGNTSPPLTASVTIDTVPPTTGSASVDPAVGATVGLGDNARIVIPPLSVSRP
ncbi:hypothetical protein PTH_0195 [Pelotomaculum thermopropionicum SI]|uniref:Fibronectin type-III domain-containing protein n=1 Tax=Pelotomaculum thermopropionicum (strain DSM 13744 / JCM 10971 / SI) TaxID=370438 RepID=A5D5U4_PELTS|nr:hypothetical protein PTH_0195 [Pelotomaculum thermopropionicum SI]